MKGGAQDEGADILQLLQHAVGFPRFYRNWYCAPRATSVEKRWWTLVGMGLAKSGPVAPGGRYFAVTEAGLVFLASLAKEKEDLTEVRDNGI